MDSPQSVFSWLSTGVADTHEIFNGTFSGSTVAMDFITERGVHSLQGFFMCLAFLVAYDVIFSYNTPGRWFHIHAVANAITVVFTIPAMVQWVLDPLSVCSPKGQEAPDPLGDDWLEPKTLFHPSNDWAVLMIIAVHTYHCLAFKLSAQDIFHHFLFVPTIGVYGGFMISWGPIRNCMSFFISGLPGGIDYVMLTLLKRGMVTKLTTKKLSASLNVWIRGPGCGCLVPATIYACFAEGRLDPGRQIQCLVLAGFAAYNGLHYMEMAVMNYQMHLTRTMLEKSHSAEIAKMKEYWEQQESATVQVPTAFDLPELVRSSSSGSLSKKSM